MTQTLGNLDGGWAASAPFRPWSSCHPRRKGKGAPIYKQQHRYRPKTENEPQRQQPKQQHRRGHWFQPPQSPYWATYSHWGYWGGPWGPPPMGYRKPPGPMQVTGMYGLHPFCLCCCSCWHGPWNPGWLKPPGKKKRWGRKGGGLRRHPRRPIKRSPPTDGSKLLQPVKLCGWQVPGLQAPQNTTQFIMNQIYEDMRQQEEMERQQEALKAQQAQLGGKNAPLSSGDEDSELQDNWYGFGQNPLALSPDPEENQSPAPQPVEEEDRNDHECDEQECDGKEEESEEEDEEAEGQDEEEMEEADYVGEEEKEEEEEDMEEIEEEEEMEEIEEEGLEKDEQREEENHLPLDMPLSFLLGDEEERESFINYSCLSPTQVIPKVPQEALLMLQDTNC